MLDAGDPAPDFFLPRADDPDAEYMLSAAADAGPVILAFVPPAETPSLSLLKGLAGIDWASVADGVAVLAIGESPEVTQRLSQRDLPFPVLLDRRGYVTGKYGLREREDGGLRRAIVVVDGGCSIRYAWEATDPGEQAPLESVSDVVAGL